jgi:hypothetical protein
MLKRTKGRFLLTLLVITGFAGTVNNAAPTKQERKQAVELLKDSKADLQKEMKGLSKSQLDFKPSPTSWNIRECFFHIASVEEKSWSLIESAMKKPSQSRERAKVQQTDDELLQKLYGNTEYVEAIDQLLQLKAEWKNIGEAQAAFKAARMQHLKYIKNTTEDLRNHFINMPFGTVDCYQFLLFIAAHSEQHHEQIRQIILHPAFPKK